MAADDMATTAFTVTATSNLSQPAAETLSSRNTTEYFVRFPPFPAAPDGVKIVSFRDFKEKGIKVQPGGDDNEAEVDAWGVPTVAMASSHSTDWCKSETKRAKFNDKNNPGRKRRKRKTAGGVNTGPTALDWEDYWEEREAAYRVRGSYDPNSSAYERFCQGAWDFKNNRQWPVAQKQSGPVFVWGEFLRFSGVPLIDGMGPGAKAEEPSTEPKEGGDSDSDLDADEDENGLMSGILNTQNLASMEATMKAQARGEAFLADPAGMLKVFFSSYARDRGIIWTDANLTGAPILMRFFVNFLVDNKVLPNREENAIKHTSTRRVIEVAFKELPLTSKLSKVWPDEFHRACKGCWGSKAEVFVFSDIPPVENAVDNSTGGGGTIMETHDGQARPNVSGWGGTTDGAQEEPPNSMGNTTNSATNEQSSGWGSAGWKNESAWGEEGTAWDSRVITVDVNEDMDEDVGAPPETLILNSDDKIENDKPEVDDQGWNAFNPPSFFSLLGPTALPITHTSGIVESSLRRIKAVLSPSADTSKFPISKDVSPDAVEGVLRRTLGVVIFEPWLNWNNGEEPHLSMPKILESSRGIIKIAEGRETTTDTNTPTPSALPPFDPHKDNISVLVDSAYLDLFSVGMGCLCTWVQLARMEDFEPQVQKKKKRKNANLERLWYIEEALRVVPSYYTYPG